MDRVFSPVTQATAGIFANLKTKIMDRVVRKFNATRTPPERTAAIIFR
jgi:hypothetical protein